MKEVFEDFKLYGNLYLPGLGGNAGDVLVRQADGSWAPEAPSTGGGGGGSAFPMDRSTAYWKDDFFGFGVTSYGYGQLTELPWQFRYNAAASTTFTGANPLQAQDHPGQLILQTGSTANTGFGLWIPQAHYVNTNNYTHSLVLDGDFDMRWVVAHSNWFGAGNSLGGLFARYGVGPGGFSFNIHQGATPTQGIYLEKLGTDTNWHLVTRTGGTQNKVSLGVPPAHNTFQVLRLRKVGGTVHASLDGGAEVSSSSYIPSSELSCPLAQVNSATTDSLYAYFDFFDLYMDGLTR